MFSGIIQAVGTIRGRERIRGDIRLRIESPDPVAAAIPGESIAVNGVCLTVEQADASGIFTMTLSARTERETNLGRIDVGTRVNLERALAAGDRLGGHFVYGHVDCMAPLVAMERRGGTAVLTIRIPASYRRYVVPRGSIAVDGISLTVGETTGDIAAIWLVPYTLAQTTLPFRQPGDPLNVEVDMLARYVESFLRVGRYDHEESEIEFD